MSQFICKSEICWVGKTKPICGAKNPTNKSIDYCINSIIFVKFFFFLTFLYHPFCRIIIHIMMHHRMLTPVYLWVVVVAAVVRGWLSGAGVGYRIEVSKIEGELRKCQVYGRWALLSKRQWGGVVWTYFTGKWHNICQVTARKHCAFRLMVSNRGVLKSNYSVE